MNWDQSTWDSGFYDEPTPSEYFQSKPKQPNKVKRTNHYPSRIGDQVNRLDNYAMKLPIHGPTIGVVAGVNDAKFGNHVLGTWLSAARNFSPSTTNAVDDVLTGAGTVAMVLPTFTAPALPAGVTAALPGTLTRIFALIAKMKLASAMTEAIATDLGIIGSETTEKTVPKFMTEMLQGSGCQCVAHLLQIQSHGRLYRKPSRHRCLGVPRHRHRKPLHRRAPDAHRRHTRSARIPHALLGQRHAERRLDRCGESHGVAVAHLRSRLQWLAMAEGR